MAQKPDAVRADAPAEEAEFAASRRRYEAARIAEALRALLDALARREEGPEETDAWAAAAVHWTALLTREQRRLLLEASIAACATEDVLEILDTEFTRMTTGPGSLLAGVKEDASAWARLAPHQVLKAYLIAAFRALPKKDRIAALPALQRFALK